MPNRRSSCLIASAVLLSLAAAVPATAAPKLRTGIYDCTKTDGEYVNSVEIRSKGRYVFASQRKGATLKRTSKGTFKLRGGKIVWTSGAYKRGDYVSEIHSGYFSIDRRRTGVWTGISCNLQKRP